MGLRGVSGGQTLHPDPTSGILGHFRSGPEVHLWAWFWFLTWHPDPTSGILGHFRLGPEVPLGHGSGEFSYLKNNIHKLKFLKDVVLQTYKTPNNYLEDLISAKKFVDLNILGKRIN